MGKGSLTDTNLGETWIRVREDTVGQLRLVQNANQFARDYLTPHAHALYLWEVVKAIETQPQTGAVKPTSYD